MKAMDMRPLYLVEKLFQGTTYKITYAYDDLVFIEHSRILIRFSPAAAEELFLYINRELNGAEGKEIRTRLSRRATDSKIALKYAGTFSMQQKEGGGEEIELKFFDE